LAAGPSIGRATLVEQSAPAEAIATYALYERHSAKIHAYCLHQLGSREEAEDALQTTFMNAFRALRKGVVPETEAAWLYKIAENVCLSRRRSSWRRNRIESPADFQVIEEVVAGPNRQRDELIGIEDALASMPEQQRRAILLREWQGLSYREISEELEVSQSAVETLIFRARRSLAQELTEPRRALPAKRGALRRARRALDLTSLVGLAKSFLAGSAALKATTAAVAVTAVAGGAAVVPQVLDPKPKPPLEVLDAPLAKAAAAAKPVVVPRSAAPAAVPPAAEIASLHARAVAPPVGRDAPPAHAASRSKPQRVAPAAAAKPKAALPERAGPKLVPPTRGSEQKPAAAKPEKLAPRATSQTSVRAAVSKPAKTKTPARPKPARATAQPKAAGKANADARKPPVAERPAEPEARRGQGRGKAEDTEQ
jgi:RNA polymerase sigma factor (sigma-70 family)